MEDFNYGSTVQPYSLKKHSWILGNPEISDRVWIGAFCLIDAFHASLKIGRGTEISSGVQILTHSTLRRAISERRFKDTDSAPIEIGEFCFIGTYAIILMGAKIGHHSVVAAGAVVPQFMIIPPYSLVVGVPAKIIGKSKKFLKGVEKESISIVIPAYNEEETIEDVVKGALEILKGIRLDFEIVLVNDGSNDQTGNIINRLSKNNKRIYGVHHKKNKGFTGAMKTGFQSAKKHFIFLAPADGQFDFAELPKFIDAIKGYDVATAYIISNNQTFWKKLKVSFFHLPYLFLSRYFLGIHLREFSSVSLWRRNVYQSIKIESEDKSAMFLPELISKALKQKYKFNEVPITLHGRKGGKAKGASIKVAIKTFFAMINLWFKLNKVKFS